MSGVHEDKVLLCWQELSKNSKFILYGTRVYTWRVQFYCVVCSQIDAFKSKSATHVAVNEVRPNKWCIKDLPFPPEVTHLKKRIHLTYT